MNIEGSRPSTACPPREALTAFQRGQLEVVELESVASHITVCQRCSAAMAELTEPEVVHKLRSFRPSSGPSDPECMALEQRAQAIELEDMAARTVSHQGIQRQPRTEEEQPARTVGPYRLLQLLGRGSMGIVYKASQGPLKRDVALKLLVLGGDSERFMSEGQALARLRHPGVVQIYELGAHEGQLYYAMECYEGGTLARKLKDGALSEKDAATIVAGLADALDAVHQAGVLHRDVKPSNVLFAGDGTPRLADFGLAKLLDESRVVSTISNGIIGTLAYMAPEQASGAAKTLTFAADIYALGAILYECLTGRKPFPEKNEARLLKAVRDGNPTPPAHLRPGLSPVLEAICLKCLEKQPAARFQRAAEVGEELQRWLDMKPTVTRPRGPLGARGVPS